MLERCAWVWGKLPSAVRTPEGEELLVQAIEGYFGTSGADASIRTASLVAWALRRGVM